ncbi:outer membrane porin, OprD family [Pseudomonas fulva]|nr:OprD family outer membrane porin [Pseudomonas fulva]MBF8778113.1 outer membrane porin, OprD family [Pseudomonas fulva]
MSSISYRPCFAAALVCLSANVQAEILSDSELVLDLKNFYYDRDYHGDAARQSQRREWAQGITVDWRSGWTSGPFKVGVDLNGMLGLRLDSSMDRSGSGLIARDSKGRPEPDYSALSPTLKAQWADNDVRVGLLTPQLPLLASNGSRLFPQRFRGLQWTGDGPSGLTVHALRIDRTRLRDSSGFESMSLTPQAGSYNGAASAQLDYVGLDWEPISGYTFSVHGQRLENIMRRTYLGAKGGAELGPGRWFAEVRFFHAAGDGREEAGEVDSRTLSTLIGYKWKGHGVSGGVQRVWGDTAYAYLNGADTYLFSEQLVSTFGYPKERALHLRYDYDFAALGIPGLTFNLRYVKGEDIDLSTLTSSGARQMHAKGEDGREWERTLDLSYNVQSGPFKGVYMRWRNGHYQSNFADPADENRLTVGYRIEFW